MTDAVRLYYGRSTEQVAATGVKVKEADFYEPFAEWLQNDLDELTTGSSPAFVTGVKRPRLGLDISAGKIVWRFQIEPIMVFSGVSGFCSRIFFTSSW